MEFPALWWPGEEMRLMALLPAFATLHSHHLSVNVIEAAPRLNDDQ